MDKPSTPFQRFIGLLSHAVWATLIAGALTLGGVNLQEFYWPLGAALLIYIAVLGWGWTIVKDVWGPFNEEQLDRFQLISICALIFCGALSGGSLFLYSSTTDLRNPSVLEKRMREWIGNPGSTIERDRFPHKKGESAWWIAMNDSWFVVTLDQSHADIVRFQGAVPIADPILIRYLTLSEDDKWTIYFRVRFYIKTNYHSVAYFMGLPQGRQTVVGANAIHFWDVAETRGLDREKFLTPIRKIHRIAEGVEDLMRLEIQELENGAG